MVDGTKWKVVRSRHNSVAHYAPRVPDALWMVDRVTLCWPRGQRKAWFEDVGGKVTCAQCLALMARKGDG